MLNEGISLVESKTFWGSLFALLAIVAGAFHQTWLVSFVSDPANVDHTLTVVTTIVSVGGSLFAILGRAAATKQITSVLPPTNGKTLAIGPWLVLLLAGVLSGCLGAQPNPATPKGVYAVEAAYDAGFLAPAARYRTLPACPDGAHFSAANPCSEMAIIVKLRAADAKASIAIQAARAFTLAHPTLDPSAYVSAANSAVSAAIAILAVNGVKL